MKNATMSSITCISEYIDLLKKNKVMILLFCFSVTLIVYTFQSFLPDKYEFSIKINLKEISEDFSVGIPEISKIFQKDEDYKDFYQELFDQMPSLSIYKHELSYSLQSKDEIEYKFFSSLNTNLDNQFINTIFLEHLLKKFQDKVKKLSKEIELDIKRSKDIEDSELSELIYKQKLEANIIANNIELSKKLNSVQISKEQPLIFSLSDPRNGLDFLTKYYNSQLQLFEVQQSVLKEYLSNKDHFKKGTPKNLSKNLALIAKMSNEIATNLKDKSYTLVSKSKITNKNIYLNSILSFILAFLIINIVLIRKVR